MLDFVSPSVYRLGDVRSTSTEWFIYRRRGSLWPFVSARRDRSIPHSGFGKVREKNFNDHSHKPGYSVLFSARSLSHPNHIRLIHEEAIGNGITLGVYRQAKRPCVYTGVEEKRRWKTARVFMRSAAEPRVCLEKHRAWNISWGFKAFTWECCSTPQPGRFENTGIIKSQLNDPRDADPIGILMSKGTHIPLPFDPFFFFNTDCCSHYHATGHWNFI